MEVLDRVRMEKNGRITLPDAVLAHYHLRLDTPIRIVETSTGILLIPLTDEPMDEDLREELAAWQSVGVQTWQTFPYAGR